MLKLVSKKWRAAMLKIVLSVLVSMFISLNSYADVLFELEQKETDQELLDQIKGKVKDNSLRMDFYENGEQLEGSMIFIGDKKEIVIINHEDKTYMIMDEAMMNTLAQKMNEAMSQMEAAMKDMPPEQREQLKEMMKGKMPGMAGGDYVEPVLKKTGSGEVNGISCIKYDVFKGDEKIRQHCVANWNSIEGGEEMMSVMLQMADFMDQMTKSFSQSGSMVGSQVQFERSVFDQMRKLNGFPIETIEYEGGSVEAESTFKSSKKGNINAADMAPPADYTLQSIDMGMN